MVIWRMGMGTHMVNEDPHGAKIHMVQRSTWWMDSHKKPKANQGSDKRLCGSSAEIPSHLTHFISMEGTNDDFEMSLRSLAVTDFLSSELN